MGNIINDIVEEVNIKPNKNKLVLKWIISIACSLIAAAFILGQFKSSFFNRMDRFEESMNKNTAAIESMETKMDKNFVEVNTRIDKGYSDGFEALQDYQEFNKKQLILVLDYGQTNKELLKEMLEINMQEKQKSDENQMNQARNELISTYQPTISVQKFTPEYYSEVYFIEVETNDTIFNLTGATQKYIDSIDRNKYEIGAQTESPKYPDRYDVAYRRKK